MKIAMIGTGYVGLVSGVCFAEFGFQVTCVDKNPAIIERLQAGEVTIYEPGLDELLTRNARDGRLIFTTELASTVADADVIFIAVGTPSRRGDGEADLQYIYAAADEIAAAMKPGAVIVIKSTVVVGTNADVRAHIAKARPDVPFSMVSNPEFLREGSAVEDFLRPDRVVVGVHDERGSNAMKRVYRPLYLRETPMIVTTLENAGDGCFLMNGQDFATAVKYGLPIIVLVINNNIYGTIRMHQEREYPGRVSATDLTNPDFALLARAYGGHGETVEATADFEGAWQRAVQSGKPSIIEIRLDPEAITPAKTLTDIRNKR